MCIVVNTTANGLVILVFLKTKSFRNKLFNWYVTSLAAADFLVSLDMTHSFLKWWYGRWPLGEVICNIFFTIIYSAICISSLTILGMSVDRYLCVSRPLDYKRFQGAPRTRMLVAAGLVGTWLAVFLVYGILAFGWNTFTGHSDLDYSIECEMPFIKSLAMNVIYITVQFIIPLILLSYFNLQVCYKIKRQAQVVRSHSNNLPSIAGHSIFEETDYASVVSVNVSAAVISPGPIYRDDNAGCERNLRSANSNATKMDNRKKSVVLLASYVVVFLLCWTPFNVMILIDTLCASCTVSVNVYVVCVYILDLNSLINPIIYTLRNATFRKRLRTLFRY